MKKFPVLRMKMALLMFLLVLSLTKVTSTSVDMALVNVTRFNFGGGDLFSIPGTECGPTACMEVSHGTALSAMGSPDGCACQCQKKNPAFREDLRVCVNNIDECQMATFGHGPNTTLIPYIFLPMKGQIINPSRDIVFTDVEEAMCVVTSAQYLSTSGWVTLRDIVDNDVPFGLYRDEGKTFLQWRGSAALHSRLEGRMVAAHVLCSAQSPPSLHTSCAVFRIAGTSRSSVLDVRSIPFHAGEIVSSELSSQNPGLSVLECLAIGVCVLMLIFVYAAGIVFYIHYKQRANRKDKDPEDVRINQTSPDNRSPLDARINLDGVHMKTNPLLGLDSLGNDYLHDAGLSDVSERTEETLDSSPNNSHKFQKVISSEISAIIHNRRKKPVRPSIRTNNSPELITERLQRRSASPDTFERAPQSDLAIIDCSMEGSSAAHHSLGSLSEEPAIRRKLYFNAVFFENEYLKNPPPAAVDFLIKIREVMSVAKEKMLSKRFIPILSDIQEEELYHTIDLGWDIPCAKRGRRFSAISLKRENHRRTMHCGGCPGCDSNSVKERELKYALTRSNSCKSCVSDDYKQKIVRKWLNEVPSPTNTQTRPVKSIAKVSGTPRLTNNKKDEDDILIAPLEALRIEETNSISSTSSVNKEINEPLTSPHKKKLEIKVIPNEVIDDKLKAVPIADLNNKEEKVVIVKNINHATRRVRKQLPPPPPPPVSVHKTELFKEEQEVLIIPPEVQVKMKAVIKELNNFRRTESIPPKEFKSGCVASIAPKIVIPVIAADSQYYSDDNLLSTRDLKQKPFVQLTSLERSNLKKRRFSVACGPDINRSFETECQLTFNSETTKLSQSWRDVRQAVEGFHLTPHLSSTSVGTGNRSRPKSEIFINNISEPVYGNIPIQKLGPLTIKVSGSPVESRRSIDEFDQDTLDRKPKQEAKKRVDKILLKSGGSFKFKSVISTDGNERNEMLEPGFSRKIGSLRQIYEAKAKAQDNEIQYKRGIYERRTSVTAKAYDSDELASFMLSMKTPDLLHQTELQKPPIPPKQRRGSDMSFSNITHESSPRRFAENKERPAYNRQENILARRSGRRSSRTRSRRTDLRKLTRTEDSGYLSTDSNESKRRANYLMQLKPRLVGDPFKIMSSPITETQKPLMTLLQIDTDTDDMESLCDGRSESGGESIETDSVFYGNFDESKKMLADLSSFEPQVKHQKLLHNDDQIDSGFMGETNIILSGDSDSEHKSVISIVAGNDGRASSASITHLDESLYMHSIEC